MHLQRQGLSPALGDSSRGADGGCPLPRVTPAPIQGPGQARHPGASMPSHFESLECDFPVVTARITSETVRVPRQPPGTFAQSQDL